DILTFTAATDRATPRGPDLAFATLPLLNRLRDALSASAGGLAGRRSAERRRPQWGVPKLFFFHKPAQAEYVGARSEAAPVHSEAELRLIDLLDDALMVLVESADVRRAARATPGLNEAARALAGELDL